MPAPAPEAPGDAAAAGRWIRELGSENFRARLEAEAQLRKLGDRALPELRRAAESDADHEVQWRARRLVREIERGEARGLQQRPRNDARSGRRPAVTPEQARPMDGIEQRFEGLFRDMEQRFGLDIPRARFFHDDFFRDLQEQMRSGIGRSQGMSMQIGPDGKVRVEIKETDADGKVETKVFEAPDLQTFEQQYPGVLQRGGLGFDLRAGIDPDLMLRPFWPLRRDRADAFGEPVPLPLPPDAGADDQVRSGQRLGIAVHPEIPAELREHLDLPAGRGLMVQSVAADSLAMALGLRPADIVVQIGERAIGAPADVQAALAAIEAGAVVEVRFLRKGVEQSARAPKPAAASEAGTPPTRGLRRRGAADEPSGIR
ncbi:MAG: PDZ domain-containing protein [Planctomycetes bacterium]|nr:PDZ domain-containing protein [Planctomycetota bacterium]